MLELWGENPKTCAFVRASRSYTFLRLGCCALVAVACSASASHAQVAPSPAEKAGYRGLHAAAARGDAAGIQALIAKGGKPDVRDGYARTPLHVAAYGGHHEAMRALVAAGANPNALERDRYDIVTIAAVAKTRRRSRSRSSWVAPRKTSPAVTTALRSSPPRTWATRRSCAY